MTTTTDPSINNNTLITNANTFLHTQATKLATAIYGVWSVVKINTATNGNCYFGLSTSATNLGGSYFRVMQSGTAIQVDGNQIIANVTTGIWYVMFWFCDFTSNTSGGYMMPLSGSQTEPIFNALASANAAQPSVLTGGANALGISTIDFEVAEIVSYDTILGGAFRQSVLNYLFSKYGAFDFPLPLIFPTNSSPQPN